MSSFERLRLPARLLWLLFAMVWWGGCALDSVFPELQAIDRTPATRDAGVDVADGRPADSGAAPGDAEPPGRDAAPAVDVPFVDAAPTPTDTPDRPLPEVEPEVDRTLFEEPPIVDFFSPAAGSLAGGELVVVEGEFFSFDAEVWLGGEQVAAVDWIDRLTLAFITPPRAAAGPVELKVITPGGSGVGPFPFVYEAPFRVADVIPSSGPLEGGVEVEVMGTGFAADLRLFFGAREAEVLDVAADGTAARVRVPPGSAPGSAPVHAWQGRMATWDGVWTWWETPRIEALVPPAVPLAGGVPVRLDGAGFDTTCSLRVDDQPVAMRLAPEGWIEVSAPSGPAGDAVVAVDCGTRGAALAQPGLRYVDEGQRAWQGAVPDRGMVSGGEVVSLIVPGLEGDADVTFGGRTATVLARHTWGLEVLTPAADGPGTVDVVVEDEVGPLVATAAFLYRLRPSALRLSPSAGPVAGGWSLTVDGEALDGVDGWWVDGQRLMLERGDDRRVVLRTRPGLPGTAAVWMQLGALRVQSGLSFSYVQGETRGDGFAPQVVTTAGGTPLQVSGTGFGPGCTITVDGEPIATEVLGDGLLLGRTPARAAGNAEVGVTGCAGAEGWSFAAPLRYVSTRIPGGGAGGGPLDGDLVVTVLDQLTGAPIEAATVMVQIRDTSPFVARTDARGEAAFASDTLTGPQTVTAFAPGRSAESMVDVPARRVTLLLAPLPTPPCDPADPDCRPPTPDPLSEIVGFLSGMEKSIDPPPGTTRWAVVETTRLAPGFINPDPGNNSLLDNGPFRITTRNGDQSLVALCGYRFIGSGQFVPLFMGVVRNIAQRPGDVYRTSVVCDIPLSEVLTVKLTGAPVLAGEPQPGVFPGEYRARVALDFGGEGVFEALPRATGSATTLALTRMPPLTGRLRDVRLDVTAGAYPVGGNFPSTESWSFNVADYGVVTMPSLLAVPQLTIPEPTGDGLIEGFVEWTMDPEFSPPDFFFISATASGGDFPRWTLFVPGGARSFHFADFPQVTESLGAIEAPGQPLGSLGLSIRAVDAVTFDYADFSRVALRMRNWRASSITFTSVTLPAGPLEF